MTNKIPKINLKAVSLSTSPSIFHGPGTDCVWKIPCNARNTIRKKNSFSLRFRIA